MKVALVAHGEATRLVVVHGEHVIDLALLAGSVGGRTSAADTVLDGVDSLPAFLAGGEELWRRATDLLDAAEAADERFRQPLASVELRAPLVTGAKVLCHVVNYADHGAEAGIDPPERPFFFLKPSSSVVGPYDPIIAHRSASEVDYEVEVAAVIGRPGRDIPAGDAYRHIAGYVVLNDISYRDLQFNRDAPGLSRRYGQNWTQGKGLDNSCPLGPWITLADELPSPYPLWIRSWVDGRLRQDANTADQIFKLPELIEAISTGMTLLPGDLIATGTPPGNGLADGAYLRVGQTVRCEVEGLGALVNEVVADDRHEDDAGQRRQTRSAPARVAG